MGKYGILKWNIWKNLIAAIVIVVMLCGMEGIQGIGTIKAEAAYDDVEPGDSIEITDNNTYVYFCYYSDSAEGFLSSSDYTSSQAISYGPYDVNEAILVPGVDAAGGTTSGFDHWKYMGKRAFEGKVVVAYAAVYMMRVTYYSHGLEGTSEGINMSRWVDGDETIQEVISYMNSSNVDNTQYTVMKGADTFSHEGYRLVGWYSGWDDFPTLIEFGSTERLTRVSNEYEAVWQPIPTVDVTYRPNGGKGTAISQNKAVELDDGGDFGSIELLTGADFSRTGYNLAGWKVTNPDNTDGTEEYDLGATCTFSANTESLTFDAIWERIPELSVSIQYRPNGGTGDTVSQSTTVTLTGDYSTGQISLLDKVDFKRDGYTLAGWTDGNKTYDLGKSYTFDVPEGATSKSLTFDAVWTEKKKGTVDISIKKPAYVGAELKYDIDKNSKGDVKVEYKKKGAKDDDYSKKVPTEPGKYTARATLEETDEYTSAEDTTDFELVYLDAPETPFTYTEIKNSAGTVTDLNVVPASGYSIGITGAADASFGSSVLYSKAKEAGGVYLKRDDGAITGQVQLTAYTVTDKPSITVTPASAASGKIYYGTQFTVTATSLSPAEKTIMYKKAGAADSTYSSVVPTEPDKYTVRVTAPATDFYAAVNEKADFTIEYLEAPSDKAYLDGKEGNEGWFKSEVEIKAPKGYLISTTLGTGYTDSIKWSDKIKMLYYKRDDGAMTDGVAFNMDAKIDSDAPEVEFDNDLGIKNPESGVSVCLDELSFTLKDDNLDTVTVNGIKQTVTNGKCVIKLDAGSDTETITVVATDKAGNSYTFTIELSPQWMSNNVMPVGRKVKLKSSIAYSFEGGSSWMVETADTKDATVYKGGMKFYVKADKEYTFSKQ